MESTTPKVHVGPVTFDLTLLAMTLITVFIVFGLVFWASQGMTMRPKGKQNVLEYIYDFVNKIIQQNLGEKASRYAVYAFSLFTFLLVANNIGLVTKLQTTKGDSLWMSPTANLFFALGLSFIISIFNNIQGIKEKGWKHYCKDFLKPCPVMLPMNLLEEITNFLSLGLRLFGNIYAGELLIGLLADLAHISQVAFPIAFLLTLIWTAFSVFISGLQAYVFVLLAGTYLGKKVGSK